MGENGPARTRRSPPREPRHPHRPPRRHRPRPRQGQRPARAWAPPAPTGFTISPTSSSRSGSTTTVTVTPADDPPRHLRGPGRRPGPPRPHQPRRPRRRAPRRAARHQPDVHIHIDKDIPVAGGMAGGSADGAGALLACDALWGTDASHAELLDICAELGSDVPFSLVGGAALGTGRGEQLAPLEVGGTFHWVFAVADGGLSTPAVYPRVRPAHPGRHRPRGLPRAARRTPYRRPEGPRRRPHQRPPARRPVPAPLPRGHPRGGHGCGRPGRAGLGLGPDHRVPVRRRRTSARAVASALTTSGTCRTARVASSPAPGATVLPA